MTDDDLAEGITGMLRWFRHDGRGRAAGRAPHHSLGSVIAIERSERGRVHHIRVRDEETGFEVEAKRHRGMDFRGIGRRRDGTDTLFRFTPGELT